MLILFLGLGGLRLGGLELGGLRFGGFGLGRIGHGGFGLGSFGDALSLCCRRKGRMEEGKGKNRRKYFTLHPRDQSLRLGEKRDNVTLVQSSVVHSL